MNYEIKDFAQGTEEWYQARAGRITGTRLARVISSKADTRKELIYELIAETILPVQDVYQSDAMARGHLVEGVIKEIYGGDMQSVGFIQRTDEKYLWLSPDAIRIDPDGKIRNAAEIKAPMGKNFVKYWLMDGVPDEYYWQHIHYFVVLEDLEWLDFMITNPDVFDKDARLKVIRIYRKDVEAQIFAAKAAIAEFTVEWTDNIRKFVANVEKARKN